MVTMTGRDRLAPGQQQGINQLWEGEGGGELRWGRGGARPPAPHFCSPEFPLCLSPHLIDHEAALQDNYDEIKSRIKVDNVAAAPSVSI